VPKTPRLPPRPALLGTAAITFVGFRVRVAPLGATGLERQVVVLDGGRIVEQGPPVDLLACRRA